MVLDEITIMNFRSIKELKFSFNPRLRILIGKNEAGKSNLLRAFSLLSNNVEIDKGDLRETLPDEDEIKTSSIRFLFKFTPKDHDQIFNNAKEVVYSKNVNRKIVKIGSKEFSIKELLSSRPTTIYDVDILANTKAPKYFTFNSTSKLIGVWKKLISGKQSPFGTASKFEIYNGEEIPPEYAALFEDLNISELHSILGRLQCAYTKANLPRVIVWNYDESNLLPHSINIDEFISDPDSFVPLKNMFKLAGIDNIKDSIDEAMGGSANKLINLLNRVADKNTKHFREVWREYKSIKFSLVPNGDLIIPSIEEQNRFLFSQRSDGFKRFVTFLLMISANNKNNSLNDCLILIDEPDIGLHPSGIRYLRDELIKISKNNNVGIATHSIFMIDRDNIKRHIMVSKEKEQTYIEIPDEHNIVDEEVIFTAVGHSIYDFLKPINILFEGWRDKKLFRTAITSWPPDYKYLDEFFQKVGTSHSLGVNQIKHITPIFEFAKRECFIISDSDQPAINKQKEFNKGKCYGTWLRYDEIDDLPKIITGEDFIEVALIEKAIKSLPKNEKLVNPPSLSGGNVIECIKVWLMGCGLTVTETENLITEIKEYIFENIDPKSIKPIYYKLLKNFSEIVDKRRKL